MKKSYLKPTATDGGAPIGLVLPAADGDRLFDRLDDHISQEELRALSDQYKRIAGCSIEELAPSAARSAT